eukprot:scaffold154772_cov50-Cyclotella_meneghiniana.AAC.1
MGQSHNAKRFISTFTPSGVLDRADKSWKHFHFHGGGNYFYLSPLSSTWAGQQLGLTLTLTLATSISNHIYSSFNNIKYTLHFHIYIGQQTNTPPN